MPKSTACFTAEGINYTYRFCGVTEIEYNFALRADSYENQSDADRAAHKAVPIQAGLVLAGSVESIVITVNVTV